MPAQCPYTVCALSNSIICGKPSESTCPFIGKQKDYRSDLWFHSYWCASSIQSCMGLEQPSRWCEMARSTGSVSPWKCGTGKKAGHTQWPQLACFASINCKLLSLNISFTQLNLSRISVEFHIFLKIPPAYCFSGRQVKKENGYIYLPEM